MTNNDGKRHPSLVYYGRNTPRGSFPLILIVGREPQVDEIVDEGMGPYDFVKHPRCAFWNMAYRLVAAEDGRSEFNTSALKRECIGRQASPIVISDALPICLSDKNLGRTKLVRRRAVPKEQIADHVSGIFNLPIVQRVRLVVLSGHGEGFEYATERYRAQLAQCDLPFIETPFLYGNNGPAIAGRIKKTGRGRDIASVLRDFRQASIQIGNDHGD